MSLQQAVYRGRMKLHVLVVAVTACGGGGKGPATPAAGGKPVYAPMFVKGASWTFSSETKTTPPIDMGQPTTEAKPDITCTVADVHEMHGASMATVTCTAGSEANPTGNMPPAGVYASNASGLYYYIPSDPKAHAAAPDPATLMIPAAAAERKQEGKSDDGTESWLYETKKEGDTWCGYFSSAAGDEGGWGLCFDDKGLVKSNHFQAGATTQETFYKRK